MMLDNFASRVEICSQGILIDNKIQVWKGGSD
jgi:hypothetical protein